MSFEFKNRFSVIIPLYNKADYIERAILSVLNQTYQNFELIVIDDGSTDKSFERVASLNNSLITLYRQENQGVSKARNLGVEFSNHEYVVFLDADDTWFNSFLEELNILIQRFPKCGIYGINHYFKYENQEPIYDKYVYLFEGKQCGLIEDYFLLFANNGRSPFSNSGCCFPRQIFNIIGGYKVGVRLTEDSDLWCRIALKYDVAFLTKPLVTYYLETYGNTHQIFEPHDFQVSITLRNALKSSTVRPYFINSVKKLIAFQQLSLIKRAIIANNKQFAFKKLMDWNLFLYKPGVTLIVFVILFFPTNLIIWIKKKMKF